MLDRRQFHASLLALVAGGVTLSGRPVRAALDIVDINASWRFLNRMTFGARGIDLEKLGQLGREGWLDAELAKPVMDDGLAARLASMQLQISYEAGQDDAGRSWTARDEMRPLEWLDRPPEDLVGRSDYDIPMSYEERVRPADEVIAAALPRAVHADAQLREVMTQFWHDHFNVDSSKDEFTAAFFPSYDRLLREHAFGNFRALLGAVIKSPSMLRYLNNDESRASPANENLARELLELHTLGAENYLNDRFEPWDQVPKRPDGVATGYIDDDVYETARALSGWSFGDGMKDIDGRTIAASGDFVYVQPWHDPYQKRILGVEFPVNSAPMADGERVLDLLASHEGTARYVSRKLLRRFGVEEPSETYLTEIANLFHAQTEAPDQIAQVVRAIALHPEFDQSAPKLRRPFEFLAALYRLSGVDVAPRDPSWEWQLMAAGWRQHRFSAPTGHADTTEAWASTRLVGGLVNIALNAHSDWFGVVANHTGIAPDGLRTWGDLVAYWGERFRMSAADQADFIAVIELPIADDLPADEPGWIEYVTSAIIAMSALSPQHLYR